MISSAPGPLKIAFFAMLLTPGLSVGQEASPKKHPDKRKVLERFVGTWDHVITIKPPGAPESKHQTVSERSWSMGETYLHFAEVNRLEPDRNEFQMLLTYDPAKEAYSGVIMDGTSRSTVESTWSEETATMSFVATNEGGYRLKYSLRFVSADRAEAEGAFHDPDGNVVVGIEWVQTRAAD